MLEKVDEKQKSSFWYSFATNYVFSNEDISPISLEDNLFLKQAKIIEDLYDSENCIIIGRCSDYILKNKPNVISIFIYSSDKEFKINRKTKFEKTTREETIKNLHTTDEQRTNYYKHFTSQKWGDKSNYEICIDTSKLGVQESINLLEEYINKRIK